MKHIKNNLDVIENGAYYKACLFYKGELELKDIQNETSTGTPSDTALKYAIANWFYYSGAAEKAKVEAQKLRDAESALKSLEKKKIKDEVIEKSTVAEMKKLDGEIAAARKKLAELKK